MKLPFSSLVREWKESARFGGLEEQLRSIVFYAEDPASWVYLGPVIEEIIGRLGRQVCYVTSDPDDPLLEFEHPGILPFYIGSGTARTAWFRNLQAKVLVMTMPDLDTFHIKRSRHQVHYAYVHHSIVSTHMIYRPAAFDNFDSILCVGPHHKEEIQARETLHSLKPKVLIEHGYGRLDSIIDTQVTRAKMDERTNGPGARVLIAPSWGKDSILETCGVGLVEGLLAAGHRVTIRPHPVTLKTRSQAFNGLHSRFLSNPNVTFDMDIESQVALDTADIMISDWSGVAFEFAFGYERPVLFIDVPRKINNPEYARIGIEPIEVELRSEIGVVVPMQSLDQVPAHVESLRANPKEFKERVGKLRTNWIYNLGSSGAAGADYIAQVADGLSAQVE